MALARHQFTVQDTAGNIQVGATIEVRRETTGSPIAALFSDRDGAVPLGNPFQADSEGFAAFHAVGGAYRVTATKGAFSRVWRYVGVGLAQESDASSSGGLGYFDARDYGLGNGITENTAAINAAITAANAAGGGVVWIPPGTYTVVNTGTSDAVQMRAGVTLRGAGRDTTILSLGNAQEAQVVSINGDDNCAVEDIGINGNRANQTTQVHGIRIAETAGCAIRRVKITGPAHYGVGGQSGTIKDLLIDDIVIINAGGDGIDLKNTDDDNSNIVITNVLVDGYALNTTDLTVQAGIDVRGPAKLSKIHTRNPADTDCRGIRFRPGEALDANGLGGHESSLSQFICEMLGSTAVGIAIEARDVSVSQGLVKGVCAAGVYMTDDRANVCQVTCDGATIGFHADAQGGGLDASRARLVSCVANNCTSKGYSIEADDCELIGCTGQNSGTTNLVIEATADSTVVIGGDYSGSVSDLGTNTQLIGLRDTDPSFIVSASYTITMADDGASLGPSLNLDRFSASPAANDVLAGVTLRGRDSAGNLVAYVQSDAQILDPVNGSEDGMWRWRARVADVMTTILQGSFNGVLSRYPLGYVTGAGGAQTQATSKSTTVVLNAPCGQITTHNASLAANTTVSFTLTNSAIEATDQIIVEHISGGTLFNYLVKGVAGAGSATIHIRNITAGALGDALVLKFTVIKSVNS